MSSIVFWLPKHWLLFLLVSWFTEGSTVSANKLYSTILEIGIYSVNTFHFITSFYALVSIVDFCGDREGPVLDTIVHSGFTCIQEHWMSLSAGFHIVESQVGRIGSESKNLNTIDFSIRAFILQSLIFLFFLFFS